MGVAWAARVRTGHARRCDVPDRWIRYTPKVVLSYRLHNIMTASIPFSGCAKRALTETKMLQAVPRWPRLESLSDA